MWVGFNLYGVILRRLPYRFSASYLLKFRLTIRR